MALMSSGIYDALREAGASEGKARIAAEEIATTARDQQDVRGEFGILKWMVGTLIALHLAEIGIFLSLFANHLSFKSG